MKKILFLCLLFAANVSLGQSIECYCYENDNNAELLIIFGDSVAVAGYFDKACKDFSETDIQNSIDSGMNTYILERNPSSFSFTKKVSTSQSVMGEIVYIEINYMYSGVFKRKKMDVHIDYSNNFTDSFGPPNRIYKRID